MVGITIFVICLIFYFAQNAGYAEYFTDGTKNIKPYFLNIRKMFDAFKFDTKPKEAKLFIKEFGISTKWLKSQDKINKNILYTKATACILSEILICIIL